MLHLVFTDSFQFIGDDHKFLSINCAASTFIHSVRRLIKFQEMVQVRLLKCDQANETVVKIVLISSWRNSIGGTASLTLSKNIYINFKYSGRVRINFIGATAIIYKRPPVAQTKHIKKN